MFTFGIGDGGGIVKASQLSARDRYRSTFFLTKPLAINVLLLKLVWVIRVCRHLSRRLAYDTLKHTKLCTILSNGYLGSRNDEERSEMRYVMRIAE